MIPILLNNAGVRHTLALGLYKSNQLYFGALLLSAEKINVYIISFLTGHAYREFYLYFYTQIFEWRLSGYFGNRIQHLAIFLATKFQGHA